jgi:hypothetical protein
MAQPHLHFLEVGLVKSKFNLGRARKVMVERAVEAVPQSRAPREDAVVLELFHVSIGYEPWLKRAVKTLGVQVISHVFR